MPMSDSYDKCVQIAELGDKCINSNKRCRGNSRCDVTLGCVCQSGYNRYGNLCIPREPLGKRKAYIGESCNDTSDCLNNYHLECVQNRCACARGFKPPDQSTTDAYPFSPLVCVNDNFKLGTTTTATTMNTLSLITKRSQGSSVEATISPTENTIGLMTTFQATGITTSYQISSSISSNSQIFNSPIVSSSMSSSTDVMSSRVDISTRATTQTLNTGQPTQTTVNHISPSSVKEPSSKDVVSSSESQEFHTYSSSFLASSSSDVKSTSVTSSLATQIFSSSIETTSVNLMTTSLMPVPSTFKSSISSRISSSAESFYQSNILSSVEMTTSTLVISEYEISSSLENILPSESYSTSSSSNIIRKSTSILSSELSLDQAVSATKSTTTSIMDPSLLTPSSHSYQFTHSSSSSSTMPSVTSTYPVPMSSSVLLSSVMISTTTQITNTSVPPVNSPCEHGVICPNNAVCTETSCGRKCVCKNGYAPDQNNNCAKVVTLGQDCGSDKICMGPKATCEDGKCQCLHGYKPDETNTRCKKSTSWFIEFPLLMEECSIFFKECHNAFEQECRKDKCTCREGLRKKTLIEMKKSYKSYKQCLNETDTEGIQIMQGVIIGGGLLVVFLIAGLITMVLCIRYKRRIGDMRSETSSIVSLDRCSEGKYSFRIPRPFATPILYARTGETDTDAMSFQNTAYDSERERLRDEEHKSINGTMARGFNLKSEDIEFKFYEDDKENKEDK
ncbi:hypothetical protein FSP39_021290 [Pinctada imbricata]|uniref:EGF-like domain-containing protein n=1 Tax=Pinctada imbricata TaxID=66713 RepID=A0AA88YJA1_PINIB|nr:hypothetical protein FSP39_021290 [Pinctada imbricata]